MKSTMQIAIQNERCDFLIKRYIQGMVVYVYNMETLYTYVDIVVAYTVALHRTARCIQEDTHRCCCCWQCMSHRLHRGRLERRGRGTVLEVGIT